MGWEWTRRNLAIFPGCELEEGGLGHAFLWISEFRWTCWLETLFSSRTRRVDPSWTVVCSQDCQLGEVDTESLFSAWL